MSNLQSVSKMMEQLNNSDDVQNAVEQLHGVDHEQLANIIFLAGEIARKTNLFESHGNN